MHNALYSPWAPAINSHFSSAKVKLGIMAGMDWNWLLSSVHPSSWKHSCSEKDISSNQGPYKVDEGWTWTFRDVGQTWRARPAVSHIHYHLALAHKADVLSRSLWAVAFLGASGPCSGLTWSMAAGLLPTPWWAAYGDECVSSRTTGTDVVGVLVHLRGLPVENLLCWADRHHCLTGNNQCFCHGNGAVADVRNLPWNSTCSCPRDPSCV